MFEHLPVVARPYCLPGSLEARVASRRPRAAISLVVPSPRPLPSPKGQRVNNNQTTDRILFRVGLPTSGSSFGPDLPKEERLRGSLDQYPAMPPLATLILTNPRRWAWSAQRCTTDRKYEVSEHMASRGPLPTGHAPSGSTVDGYLACFGVDTMLLQPRGTGDFDEGHEGHEGQVRAQRSSEGG